MRKPSQSNGLKPLVDYIALTNKQEVAQILQNENFGKRAERKPSTEVAQDVMAYLGKEKKQGKFMSGIKKVLNAHPDKDLILELFGKPLPKKMDVMEYNAYNATAKTYDTTGAETSATPIFEKPITKISLVIVILVVLIILLLYIN